jgi:hypothetical protein
MRSRRDALSFFVGILMAAAVHGGVFAYIWITRAHAAEKPEINIGQFVDAQLVKFGKPRDLSFLPHKQGVVKTVAPPEALKVAKDMNQLPRIDDKKQDPPDKIDPLKKTRAEFFKQLKDPDQPEGFQDVGEGSLSGSRSGTATEAKGDPYILSLIDQIGGQWQVPTTIKDSDLAKLSALVCLDIADDGKLRGYTFRNKSGNSQFDSSLDAALSTIKSVPAPPDRWRGKKLCPEFVKQ